MLRCSRAGGLKLLTVALLATVSGEIGLWAAEPSPAPRTLLRIPHWIELLGDRRESGPSAQPPAAKRADSARVSRAEAQAVQQRIPVAPAVPVAPARSNRPATVVAAGKDELFLIPATPSASAAGKPGRALLRSRTPADVDGHATLASGWSELRPDQLAEGAATPVESSAETAGGTVALGPESSVLAPAQRVAAATEADRLAAQRVAPPQALPSPPTSATRLATEAAAGPAPAATAVAENAPAPIAASEPTVGNYPATVAPPLPTTPEETPSLSIDPASFRGVWPGRSTRSEVEAGWGPGEAFTREDGTAGFVWKIDPFDRVEVTLDGDTVGSIRIKLAEPVAVAELAAQLDIADLRNVSILNEQGVSIGEVFPERGLMFSLKPGTRSALAVMLEPLDPEAFVLRAEGEIDSNTAYALADLQYAVEIDPQHLRAQRLLLVLLCEQGKWRQAAQTAEAAVQLDPVDIWTRLKYASVLMALDQPAEAKKTVESVRKQDNLPPLVAAQVERMLGRLELESATPDYQKAVKYFENAIRKSAPLMANRSQSIQRASREVLLDAHVGTAVAIAKGTWQQKGRVIPKWLARGEALVAELNADADEHDSLDIQLCRGALAAAAGAPDAVDPLPWVKRLLQTRDRMGAELTDPWRRRQIDWEIGHGLSDALTASQKRGESADMLDNATLTVAFLERGAEQREISDADRATIGELLFRIGILHSLQHGDHATAVTWFDKVQPLWQNNPCFGAGGDIGRLGESYVSMAISYWQVERREDALSLCSTGVECMVEAVDRHQLSEQALAVGYGNLAMMYSEQGEEEQAKNYAEMASRAESTGQKVR